jgi:hypothetical protein
MKTLRNALLIAGLLLAAPALFAGFAIKQSQPAGASSAPEPPAAAQTEFPTAPLTPATALAAEILTTQTVTAPTAAAPREPEPDLQPLLRTDRKAVLPFYHCAYYGKCRDSFSLRNDILKDYGNNCRERRLYNVNPQDPLSSRTGMEVVDFITQAENKDHCQRLGTFLFRDAQEAYAGPATVAASTQVWSDIARPVGPLLSAPAYGAVSASTVPHLWFVWWKPGARYTAGAQNWLPVTHVSLLYVADERLAAEIAALRPFTPTELHGSVSGGTLLPVLADAYRDQVNELLAEKQGSDRAAVHYAGWNTGGKKSPAPAVLATWLDEWRFRVQELAAAPTPAERSLRKSWLQAFLSAANQWGLRVPAQTTFTAAPKQTLDDAAALVTLLRNNDVPSLPALTLKKVPADAPAGYDALRAQLLKRAALAGLDAEPARLASIGAWATLIAEARVRAADNDRWALVPEKDLARATQALDAMLVTFIPAGRNCCARLGETNAYTRWRGWKDDHKFPVESARVLHDNWERKAWDERRNVAVNGPDPTIAWRYERQLGDLYNRRAELNRVKQSAAAWGAAGSSAPAGVVDWRCDSVNRNCESRWQGGGATGGPSGVGRAATAAADLQLSGIDRDIAELQARIAKETADSSVTFQQPVDVAIVHGTRTLRVDDPDAGAPVVARYRQEQQGIRSSELLAKVFNQSEGDARQAKELASRRMYDARIERRLAEMAKIPGVTELDLARERIWLRNLLRSTILPREADLGPTGFWFRIHFKDQS